MLPYTTITGAAERSLQLGQRQELLELAARSLTRIHVPIDRGQQTAIAEEGVNVNMDCLSWQNQFPNGTTDWLFRPRDIHGNFVTLSSKHNLTTSAAAL